VVKVYQPLSTLHQFFIIVDMFIHCWLRVSQDATLPAFFIGLFFQSITLLVRWTLPRSYGSSWHFYEIRRWILSCQLHQALCTRCRHFLSLCHPTTPSLYNHKSFLPSPPTITPLNSLGVYSSYQPLTPKKTPIQLTTANNT
jgi:hypothetical protein